MYSAESGRRIRELEHYLFGGATEPEDRARLLERQTEPRLSGPRIGTVEFDPKNKKLTFRNTQGDIRKEVNF